MATSEILRFAGNLVKSSMGQILSISPSFVRNWYKRTFELLYWRKYLWQNYGRFGHEHLERTFTKTFNLPVSFYDGKDILDIGCGPSGSLEWADNAKSRTGIDPLANKYLKLAGVSKQKMKYANGTAEDLPFPNDHFDVVSLLNSLDHVEDVKKSIDEAVRVCRPNGTLLLIVEVNHAPTITEPHFLEESILEDFFGCEVVRKSTLAIREDHNIYGSIGESNSIKSSNEPAILIAQLRKKDGTNEN